MAVGTVYVTDLGEDEKDVEIFFQWGKSIFSIPLLN